MLKSIANNRFLHFYLGAYQGLSKESWLLALVILINRTGAMVIPFLSIYMSSQLHFTIAQIGVVMCLYGIGSMIGSWLGGYLTDKVGFNKVQIASLLLTIPVIAGLQYLHTVTSLGLGIMCLSTIMDSFRPANSTAIKAYARNGNLAQAYSLNRLAINLGFSVGPTLGGLLAKISFSWIFWGNALCASLAAIVFYLNFLRNKNIENLKEIEYEEERAAPMIPAIKTPYKDLPFVVFNICCMLFAFTFFHQITMMPLFYEKQFHMTTSQIGFILSFNGIIIITFEMIIVHAAERLKNKHLPIVIGSGLCAISFVVNSFVTHIPGLYMGMLFVTLGEMLTYPFMSTITSERATAKTIGAYQGFNSLAQSAGVVFSPMIGSFIIGKFGYNSLWQMDATVLILASCIYYYVLKRYFK